MKEDRMTAPPEEMNRKAGVSRIRHIVWKEGDDGRAGERAGGGAVGG